MAISEMMVLTPNMLVTFDRMPKTSFSTPGWVTETASTCRKICFNLPKGSLFGNPAHPGVSLEKKVGQSNFTKRTHRRRTWTVQSYSPGGDNVHAHPIHASLDPPESTTKWHLDCFSCFCTAHGRESLHFTMGRHFPSKWTLSHREI